MLGFKYLFSSVVILSDLWGVFFCISLSLSLSVSLSVSLSFSISVCNESVKPRDPANNKHPKVSAQRDSKITQLNQKKGLHDFLPLLFSLVIVVIFRFYLHIGF